MCRMQAPENENGVMEKREQVMDWASAALEAIREWEADELRKLEELEAVWGRDSSKLVPDRLLSRIRDALEQRDP